MSSKSHVQQCGDMFKTNLQPAPLKSSQIPANGSWWIVQVQPTKAISQKPRRCARSSSGVFENPGSFSAHSVRFEEVMVCRKDLNNPPTDVGWDSVTLQTSLLCRPDALRQKSSSPWALFRVSSCDFVHRFLGNLPGDTRNHTNQQ